MNSVKFKTKFLTVFLVFSLMFVGNSLVFFSTDADNSLNNESNRAVVGPKELLINSDFSKTSAWIFTNATYESNTYVEAKYNDNPPKYGQFGNRDPIIDWGFSIFAYINQSFTKSIWTPNYPTSVICSFDYNLSVFDYEPGILDCGLVLEISNATEPNSRNQWCVAYDSTAFIPASDPRIGTTQHISIYVGSNQSSYSICPPGTYIFSLILELMVPTGSVINVFECDLKIDNVSLRISDDNEPLVVANQQTYGPFNSAPGDIIDVDFFNGGLENTTLKEGKYRLNNSSMPKAWHTIFRNRQSFIQNWSISPIWSIMQEGNNTIDIYCEDTVGNYNDSVQITVIKDTKSPDSRILVLNNSYKGYEINISYVAIDPAPSGGYNNTVELWFRYNQTGKFVRYQPFWNRNGLFNSSPIRFNITPDGAGFGFGTYEFYTRAIDNATNYETIPSQSIKTKITDPRDTTPPVPIFTAPEKKHKRGIVTINVLSDKDTKYIEFYYWLDKDSDGFPDADDINSSWQLIDNVTSPTNLNNWTTEWNTSDSTKYPEFQDFEYKVILKASAVDKRYNRGEIFKNNIEIDNIAPEVKFLYPTPSIAENNEDLIIRYQVDNIDVIYTKFWYSKYLKEDWILIRDYFEHPTGELIGEYSWTFPKKMIDSHEIIKIKVEVFDDAENVGTAVSGFIPPPDYFGCFSDFPTEITLTEDFGIHTLNMSGYKYCSDPDIKSQDLLWYVTGNSEKIFYIKGSNNSGMAPDTFTYKSMLDKFGTEKLVFHLTHPLGLEDTFEQIITVTPVDDWPVLNFPTDQFYITYGKPDTIDLSIYISDVDNPLSELMMITDDTDHITVSGLNLTFNYPSSMNGMNKAISVQVTDGEETSKGTLNVKITDNHRPILIKLFPTDLKLKEGETLWNHLYLDHHFTDPEGLPLTYSSTSDNVIVEINANSSVTFSAKPNVNGLEKVIFCATDPLGAWVEGVIYIRLISIPDPPRISHIPDMNIHWHNPRSDDGYTYDFSYFIYDPDNDDSELIIWARAVTEYTIDNWMENDPNYNMRITLKFPFSAAGKTHIVALYAIDPQGNQAYRLFNITVIFDEWPVEQLKPIPDQYFKEDERKDNAFDLWDYFEDIDGGTNFEILNDPECMVKGDLDENNFVDISTKLNNWNTGDSYVELVILAKDTQPIQEVYSVVRVYVLPVPDSPFLQALPTINTVTKKVTILDLSQYISDVDTELKNLRIITSSEEDLDVEIEGMLLLIKSSISGTYIIDVWVLGVDGGKSNTQKLVVKVDKEADKEAKSVYIDTITTWRIAVVIIIIIIIVMLLFMAWKKKKLTISMDKKNVDKISQLPITPIKRNQAQKMSDKILDSHQTIESSVTQSLTQPSQVTSPNIPTAPSPQTPPTSLEPINQQIQTINQTPRLPPKPKT